MRALRLMSGILAGAALGMPLGYVIGFALGVVTALCDGSLRAFLGDAPTPAWGAFYVALYCSMWCGPLGLGTGMIAGGTYAHHFSTLKAPAGSDNRISHLGRIFFLASFPLFLAIIFGGRAVSVFLDALETDKTWVPYLALDSVLMAAIALAIILPHLWQKQKQSNGLT